MSRNISFCSYLLLSTYCSSKSKSALPGPRIALKINLSTNLRTNALRYVTWENPEFRTWKVKLLTLLLLLLFTLNSIHGGSTFLAANAAEASLSFSFLNSCQFREINEVRCMCKYFYALSSDLLFCFNIVVFIVTVCFSGNCSS